jgi:hypothetical protein
MEDDYKEYVQHRRGNTKQAYVVQKEYLNRTQHEEECQPFDEFE